MIQLEYAYAGIPLEVESNGEPIAADALPTAVLFRNGSASDGIVVTIGTTTETGLYLASFTTLGTGDGWAKTDRLFIQATAVISGTTYKAIIWNSFGEIDAVMRGTDSANTTTPPTVSAVADEVQTRTIARVTLVDTCTANSDMRGTDGANTATPLDAAGVRSAVGLGAANLDAQIADLPTVAEFDARTLLASDYFDPATDVVARVTLVDTVTINTDMRGTDGAYTGTPPTVVEIQSGLATAAALAVVDGVVDAVLVDTGTTLPAQIAEVKADTETLLGRVTSTVATLWANLTAMISGSGASAAYTTTALANAPGGEGDTSLSAGDIGAIVAGVTTVSSSIQQAQAGILTAYEYTTWDQDFDDLLILTNHTDIIFVLKRRLQDLDSEALLKVSSSTGLIILNGVDVSATRSDEASISITQQTPTGELSLSVESSAMAEVPRGKWIDGLKMLNPNGDKILRQGTTIVRESAVDETS